MDVPEFWIVAGPNGAGKTTCVQKAPISQIIPNVTFLNPDDQTLLKLRAHGFTGFADAPEDVQTRLFLESADEVYADLENAIAESRAVGVETVLSSDKYRTLVDSVLAAGGFVGLIYVALSSPAIAIERVANRVLAGGHGIPPGKIETRWHRSLENLGWFAAKATAFWVVDNSDSTVDSKPSIVAWGSFGELEFLEPLSFVEIAQTLHSLPRK